jgi:hypothetical protein
LAANSLPFGRLCEPAFSRVLPQPYKPLDATLGSADANSTLHDLSKTRFCQSRDRVGTEHGDHDCDVEDVTLLLGALPPKPRHLSKCVVRIRQTARLSQDGVAQIAKSFVLDAHRRRHSHLQPAITDEKVAGPHDRGPAGRSV